MAFIDLVRQPLRRKETKLATPQSGGGVSFANVQQALLVNGRMQTLGELRSSYNAGTRSMRWVGGLGDGIITGDYSREATATSYKTGITTFIGVNVRSGISAEIPVRAIDSAEEPVDDSPAQGFIDNSSKYIWRLLASNLIFGVMYVKKVYNRHGYPTGLEVLSPLDVEPELNYQTGTVARYRVYRQAGYEYLLPHQIIVDVAYNPFSDIDGTSAVEVAKVRSDIETNIGRYGAAFFANSARPDMIITTESTLTPDQQNEARKKYIENFRGVLNAFRVWMIGGAKWDVKTISSNPVDLAMVELTNQADVKVLAALRVNPVLAGIGTAHDALSAQSTYKQVREQHVEFVAIPDVRQICDMLNEQWLHKDFPNQGWSLEPDTTAIISNAMGTNERIAAAQTAVAGHIFSVNDGREHVGKNAMPNVIQINPDWALSLWREGGIRRSQLQMAVGMSPDKNADGYIYELDPRAKAIPSQVNMLPGYQQSPPPQQPAPAQIEAPKPFALPAPAQPTTVDTVASGPGARSGDVVLKAQLYELDNWRKKVKARGVSATFETKYVPDSVAMYIRSNLAEHWNLSAVFDEAKRAVRANQNPQDLGVTPEQANEYWKHFDALQVDLGAAFIDYMHGVSERAFDSILSERQAPIASAFTEGHAALSDAWVGTLEAPGPLLAIALAGIQAGQRALETEKAANPHKPRSLDIAVAFDVLSQQALDFAQSYSFDLIRQLDDTTRNGIRAAMEQGISAGLDSNALRDLIANVLVPPGGEITDAIRNRAATIAQTEGLRVYNMGAVSRWNNAGIQEGTFQNNRDDHVCPVCRPLQGIRANINVGWQRSDGTTGIPPMHVKCRCYMRPYLG